MSDDRLPKVWPAIRRRSFLATIASIAATLTITRQSYGADASASGARNGNMGLSNVGLSGETAMRPSPDQATAPIDLKTLGPEHQITSINHSGNTYRVTMASGKVISYSEFDLRFKTDASARGPAEGVPVLMPTSIDRAFVVFASSREISAFIV